MKQISRSTIYIALTAFLFLYPLSAQIPSGYVQTVATVPSLANGTYGAAWTNLSSSPQLGLLGCVSTFQTTVNGAIDSKGYFSTLLADTAQICPTPSTWTFTLTFACPGSASSGAFQVAVPVTGGGGTEDITSQITAALPANPCGGGSGGPVFYPSAVQGAIPFVLQAYPTVKLGNSGIIQTGIPGTASQTDTFPGTVAASIVNTVYYSNMYASLSAGVSAACNGTAPGKLVVPVGTTQISSTLTIPSNCHVTGAGKGQTIIQASSTFPGGELIVIPTGASNVTIDNLAADGNRSVNSAGIWCISLDGASGVDLKGVTASNCLNQGVRLIGNNAHVHIEDSEIFNNGSAAASSQSGGGISVQYYTGLGTASDVLISHNKIHDNNTGILVSGSGVVGQDVNGVTISENHIYSNANDAVSIGASNVAGGNINGLVVTGNEINCNGWPPSGAGFSVSCTPGFQQNGASQSQGGVGVDLIQQGLGTINRPIVSLNNIHDNVFEGIAPTTNITPIVSTSGTAVSWVSGPHFNVNLKAYQPVIINGTNYFLSSVGSTTSATLTTSAGTQTSVTSNFPGYMGGTFTGNTIVNSGNGNMGFGGVGPCIYNAFSDSNVFTGNVGVGCWLEGFEDFYSSFTIHNGDKAYSNGVGGAALRTSGFNNFFGLSNSYADIGTWDVTSSPSQTVGWKNSGTNASITSNQIYATTPISDLGTLTTSLINGNVAASTMVTTPEVNGYVYASQFATSGTGTPSSPWTSASGTGGIQEAINSLPVTTGNAAARTVYISSGYYLITANILITTAVTLRGAGWDSVLYVSSSLGSTTDVINVTPTSSAEMKGLTLEDFSITPQSGTPGRYGINFDGSNNVIVDGVIRHVSVRPLGNYAFYAYSSGPSAWYGTPSHFTIEESNLLGGISCTTCGDNVLIKHNLLGLNGTNTFDFVAGGTSFVFENNLVTNSGGTRFGGATQVTSLQIQNNEFETEPGFTGSNSSVLDLDGPVYAGSVSGNSFQVVNGITANGLRLNNTGGVTVEHNNFMRGATTSSDILATSTSAHNHIGVNYWVNGPPYTSMFNDSGSGNVFYPDYSAVTGYAGPLLGNNTAFNAIDNAGAVHPLLKVDSSSYVYYYGNAGVRLVESIPGANYWFDGSANGQIFMATGTYTVGTQPSQVAQSASYAAFYNIALSQMLMSRTLPTVGSGFGTGAFVAAGNGTAVFTVNVGTGGTATSGVISLPTAAQGWGCTCADTSTTSATVFMTKQTASSTTSCTVGNFNTSGVAAAWASTDYLSCKALAY